MCGSLDAPAAAFFLAAASNNTRCCCSCAACRSTVFRSWSCGGGAGGGGGADGSSLAAGSGGGRDRARARAGAGTGTGSAGAVGVAGSASDGIATVCCHRSFACCCTATSFARAAARESDFRRSLSSRAGAGNAGTASTKGLYQCGDAGCLCLAARGGCATSPLTSPRPPASAFSASSRATTSLRRIEP